MKSNLDKFEHIVVVMLENRSFDHMLGYLSLPSPLGRGRNKGANKVNGLRGQESNPYKGTNYKVFHLGSERPETWTTLYEPDPNTWDHHKIAWDPCHEADCTKNQLENNSGFVREFGEKYSKERIYPGMIMGYYNHQELIVFDHLAGEYMVCDRWFSSIPGPTTPNRIFSLGGTTNGETRNPEPPYIETPELIKLQGVKTIFEYLEEGKVSWRYYYQDFPFLYIRKKFRLSIWQDKRNNHINKLNQFKKDLIDHTLPSVAWLDPNFEGAGNLKNANDDHPPSDIRRGQEFVFGVYKHLIDSDYWKKTLLIVTYDEHGGFYDHVSPPDAEDDSKKTSKYGVRVPALIISPYVKRGGVSSETFDHTSILKTIFLKFLSKNGKLPPGLPMRVQKANDLGRLLTVRKARNKPAVKSVIRRATSTHGYGSDIGKLPTADTSSNLDDALEQEIVEEIHYTDAHKDIEKKVEKWNLDAAPDITDFKRNDLQLFLRALAEDVEDKVEESK